MNRANFHAFQAIEQGTAAQSSRGGERFYVAGRSWWGPSRAAIWAKARRWMSRRCEVGQ